ncbi:penicillin-binding protein 2 [Sediminimonas sp.]|uniref:penicillin-binding protein 2 n=1 Tax=Sediminimonas sp. TaxID=2823379 RepID=UPI0025DA88A7|nr:penicillin-binding protein 2 [Sediminimonas sp.]
MRRPPRDNADGVRRFTRRGLLLGGLQLGFMGALGVRMHYLQVDQADQFRLLAEENRVSVRLIPPERGEIFDRTGRAIAVNEPSYRITMIREEVTDPRAVLTRLARLIGIDDAAIEAALEELEQARPDVHVTVADRVDWQAIARVSVNAPALPGVHPDVGLSRYYPMREDFAHVVGYVGPVSDYDLSRIESPPPLLLIPRFQIGKVGVEAKYEFALRGKAGSRRLEVNAAGRVMRELDRRDGTPGANLQLTVDNRLQNYVQARLGEQSASAVVIDLASGDLLAIASTPSYDPNLFVRGISVADYKALTDNKYRPLASKSVQGLYPPGSTFKMVTALAALDEGLITAEDTVWCPGYLEVSGRKFHCWKTWGHGHMTLEAALTESCDVYFYDLALKVGIEKIAAMGHRLGLGEAFNVPMSAVAAGRVPTKDWKLQRFGKDWVLGDSVNAAIGQGFVLTSPLQLAVMSARLATGRAVVPRLVKTMDGVEQPAPEAAPLGLNENHLRQIRQGMFAVSNNRRGTAFRSRITAEGMRMAGKTGTSQVRNITAAERAEGVTSNEDLPWDRRDHALFVNFAPFEAPQIAVAVVIEHGGGGSSAAAPVARDITLQALYGDTPPLSAYPSGDRDRIKALQERLERERRNDRQPGRGRA